MNDRLSEAISSDQCICGKWKPAGQYTFCCDCMRSLPYGVRKGLYRHDERAFQISIKHHFAETALVREPTHR